MDKDVKELKERFLRGKNPDLVRFCLLAYLITSSSLKEFSLLKLYRSIRKRESYCSFKVWIILPLLEVCTPV